MQGRAVAQCLGVACMCLSAPASSNTRPDLAPPAASGTVTLRCGTLIDGVATTPRKDVAVRIEDGTIVAVEPFDPGTGTVIDRSRETCMPGLIDAHAHILIKTDDYQVDHLRRSSAYKSLRGLSVVQEMLRSGWTTIRIVGDADVHYAHLDVRTAIQRARHVRRRRRHPAHGQERGCPRANAVCR